MKTSSTRPAIVVVAVAIGVAAVEIKSRHFFRGFYPTELTFPVGGSPFYEVSLNSILTKFSRLLHGKFFFSRKGMHDRYINIVAV